MQQNSVPLVSGRTTILRIYAISSDTQQPITNVQVQVTASRSGATLNSSPTTLTATIPTASTRTNYASSINMQLPTTWLSGIS